MTKVKGPDPVALAELSAKRTKALFSIGEKEGGEEVGIMKGIESVNAKGEKGTEEASQRITRGRSARKRRRKHWKYVYQWLIFWFNS